MRKAFGIFMVIFFVAFTGARLVAAGDAQGNGDQAAEKADGHGAHQGPGPHGKTNEHWSIVKQWVPDALFRNLQTTFGASIKGNKDIHVSHVFFAVITFLFGVMLAFAAARKLKQGEMDLLPEKKFSAFTFFDIIIESLLKLMETMMPRKHALHALPIITSLAVFILICNIMGLVPGMLTPAESLNTTLALAMFSFVTYVYFSIKVQGVGGTLKHLMGPIPALAPLMFLIEALGFFIIRPASLSLRLLGNMFGDHQVLMAFLSFNLLLVPLPVMALGLIVCIVQTVVFCLLTMVYIAIAVEEHHHDEEHGDHGHDHDHAHAHA